MSLPWWSGAKTHEYEKSGGKRCIEHDIRHDCITMLVSTENTEPQCE